ncbi:MAG TPA: rhomboid family intramembrane serine protease [Steroidobacteraceae bacterium]|nr:rhomboid family intramembrane serine protease [Steroidobacteraceae bacterium]
MEDESTRESLDDSQSVAVPVFRGSQAACFEFGLVLDAKGIAYHRTHSGESWVLLVAPAMAEVANDELARYAAEWNLRREVPAPFIPFAGSAVGAAIYAFVLILTAYCAGIGWLGIDWFEVGALESTAAAAGEWWRAVTALTLHLDQEHLLGNLLFGVGIGVFAGRMFGPGFAWLSILLAGAAGNYLDMLVSPSWHRAVGASTAVFAALGLLAGFGWGQRLVLRDRRLYRWAPLFAGVCLLALLGAGNEHVDVLGHLLGFLVGTLLGWGFARAGWPRRRGMAFQLATGSVALLMVCSAWLLALRHYR